MKNFPKELPHGTGGTLILDPTRLLLSFKKAISNKDLIPLLKENGLQLEELAEVSDERNQLRSRQFVVNHTATRFWVRTVNGRVIDDEFYAKISENLSKLIKWIGPVYRLRGSEGSPGLLCPLPDVILLQKSKQVDRTMNALVRKFGLAEDEAKSKYLTAFRYFQVKSVRDTNAYAIREEITKQTGRATVRLENMPMIKPLATTIPNDTEWVDQWDMVQINAPDGWDISTGASSVVVCVLDEGCDLTHPDLQFFSDGINLGTMMPTGAPTGNHGTACAGIAAARINNNEGVAGLAGQCLILPAAFDAWTDVEVANGINYATTQGARVISMSFGWDPWDPTVIDPEIQNAFDADVVMCVATHNYNSAITYPATNPLVIACGASSTDDNRKSPTSPDGENWWGSDFGDIVYGGVDTGVSVVAPGVQCPTTDRQGAAGYGGGNYIDDFNGTSSATPHVAGLAALILSQYPALTNVEVRSIIERTAEKVGVLPYAEKTGFGGGTRNEEMGYGRINVFRSLDFADVLIKDWSGDDGTEPSNPPGGNFWDFSDIVVRINDDNVFNPSNPSQSKNVERGQQNFIYVQVTNKGPRAANNVVVDCRITPWIGIQFRYPDDWTLVDAMHAQPTPVTNTFPTIAAGATVIAKFTISASQTDTLYGWENSNPWHPCLLASVNAGNDYAFATAAFSADPLSQLKNNLAQRNLTVIDVLADASARAMAFPFVAGHVKNLDRFMDIVIDQQKVPAGVRLLLSLDDDGKAFPLVNFDQINDPGVQNHDEDGLVFLETTKVETKLGCCRGVLTIVKGSRFDCRHKPQLKPIDVNRGDVIIRNGKRYLEIKDRISVVRLEKQAGAIYPLSIVSEFQAPVGKGRDLHVKVSQRDQRGVTVGGATVIYQFK